MKAIGMGNTIKFCSESIRGPNKISSGQSRFSKSQAQGRGERILVVDDQQDWLWIAQSVLLAGGYQVQVCDYSPDALLLLETQPDQVDLVITDLNMPCLDGFELTAKLRKINSALPILLTSAEKLELTEAKLLALGFRGFLSKPWESELLFSTIRQALSGVGLDEQK